MLGVFPLVFGLYPYYCMLRTRHWRAANGTVTEVRIRQKKVGTRYGSETVYLPHVRYEYEVEGKKYQGNRLTPGMAVSAGYDSRSDAAARVGRYAEGRSVSVFYNPAKPAESMLELGYSFSRFTSILCIVFGLFFLTVSGALAGMQLGVVSRTLFDRLLGF